MSWVNWGRFHQPGGGGGGGGGGVGGGNTATGLCMGLRGSGALGASNFNGVDAASTLKSNPVVAAPAFNVFLGLNNRSCPALAKCFGD